MTLDLRHDAAPAVLRRLAADADVLVESARPGSMDRTGIGFAQLGAVNPGLVWCSLTGFGKATGRRCCEAPCDWPARATTRRPARPPPRPPAVSTPTSS